jgi:hypothetical protein
VATLTEIHGLAQNGDLLAKARAAVVVVAYDVLQETSGTNLEARQDWAASALGSPKQAGTSTWIYVLGANSTASKATIEAASDTLILNAVAEAVDKQFGVDDS